MTINPPATSNTWVTTNEQGRKHARELVAIVRETGNPLPLCRALGDMIRRGNYGPAEIGFVFHLVAAIV